MNRDLYKLRIPFDSFWSMRIDTPYSLLVRDGEFAWTCGQCPLDSNGHVLAPGDLGQQTRHVAQIILRLLESASLELTSVGKLVVYYVDSGAESVETMLSVLTDAFGDQISIVPVAVPYFYYEGMLIEVDVYASSLRQPSKSVIRTDSGLHIDVVESGRLVSTKVTAKAISGVRAAARGVALEEAFARIGLQASELLSDHWFVGMDAERSLMSSLESRGLATDGGAAVRTILPRDVELVGELTFVRMHAPEPAAITTSMVRDGISLTLRRRGAFFWASARMGRADMSLVEQTRRAMIAINNALVSHGLSFDEVCKATTYYTGSCAEDDLHDNMSIRNSYYSKPGPASTGIPVSTFLSAESRISIDITGVESRCRH
ncbi:MAG: hypothetical protein GAK33_04145 [Burkholderia lata]|uniref:Uncharacterized protein n=1 Tax=Burkholderia lata (strain ATCC 17760 / DSM 23089 / LMG 22485 / NCIMB 9086 / R18194 / 383) TaxID=482957 RepID=A0A833U9W5_BURL3|nr:Rid family hydrolase [Burkholderia lata]KAF1036142.1 MAG: hypothetical protein GAK33_04145 [Burkholderia lata]